MEKIFQKDKEASGVKGEGIMTPKEYRTPQNGDQGSSVSVMESEDVHKIKLGAFSTVQETIDVDYWMKDGSE